MAKEPEWPLRQRRHYGNITNMFGWRTIHFDAVDGDDPGKRALAALHGALAEMEVEELYLAEEALDFRGMIYPPPLMHGAFIFMTRGRVEMASNGRSLRYRLSFKLAYIIMAAFLGLLWTPFLVQAVEGRGDVSPLFVIVFPLAMCLLLVEAPILYIRMRFRWLLIRTIRDAGGVLR